MRFKSGFLMPLLGLLLASAVALGLPCTAVAEQGDLASAAASARQCGISPSLVDRILADSVEGRLAGEDAFSLLDSLQHACEKNVPLYPLEEKVEEGMGKRISAARILPVLVALQDDMQRAGDLLRNAGVRNAGDHAVVIIGSSMQQGLPFDVVAALIRDHVSSSADDLAAAVRLAAQLRKDGIGEAGVDSFVSAGLAHEGLMPRWRGFNRLVALARRQGIEDDSLMAQAESMLRNGAPLQDLYDALGLTSRDTLQGAGGSGHVRQ
ncbi:hypothetical protein N1030_09355 [Desulfovibrio mangrovi]|uniref:hypothetical protein n=1 Tax=Desulfovibrio mangrovi TaxID=2976983 RepID=UPI002246FBD2|nr:hypothetical protein [Desulfovibrio mangrovi]UZP65836.1 hypothetical protein N1030_09355 [Desulfovibrio mangrovi]